MENKRFDIAKLLGICFMLYMPVDFFVGKSWNDTMNGFDLSKENLKRVVGIIDDLKKEVMVILN